MGDVKPDEIKAGYEDGILRLEIPKREAKAASAPNRIAIEYNGKYERGWKIWQVYC